MNQEDARIIEQVLNGETVAFEGLVRAYQNRLFNSLVHSLGCPEEAEDVAQEAFVKSFSKLATFKQNSSFYTWLYRIAMNIAISRHRLQGEGGCVGRSRRFLDLGGKGCHFLAWKRVALVQSNADGHSICAWMRSSTSSLVFVFCCSLSLCLSR